MEGSLEMEKVACEFDGKTYFSGAEVCDAVRCMMCKEGEWVATWVSSFGP